MPRSRFAEEQTIGFPTEPQAGVKLAARALARSNPGLLASSDPPDSMAGCSGRVRAGSAAAGSSLTFG